MNTWPQASWSLKANDVNPCDSTLLTRQSAHQRIVHKLITDPKTLSLTLLWKGFCFAKTLQGTKGFSGVSQCLLEGPCNKPFSASAGDTGSILGPGRSHMARGKPAHGPHWLSPYAVTTEACMPKACALQQEKPWMSSPVLLKLEQQQQRPNINKWNYTLKKVWLVEYNALHT